MKVIALNKKNQGRFSGQGKFQVRPHFQARVEVLENDLAQKLGFGLNLA